MRKALRIILPILALLLLLGGAYLFFFHVRGDLTADIYESRADSLMESGDYNAAIKNYEKGYKLSDGSAAIGEKLAQAYEKIGNYTKTEYYLVHAIADAPDNLELYLALSAAYVNQDKLMEAQLMLDQVLNEDVRAQLNALRPAAPAISPDGGAYDTYISLSVEAADPCYLTIDGQYPSLEKDAYTSAFELPAGDTNVCAVCVNDSKLVSPASYVTYTVAGVVEDVAFQNRNLEAYIQELLSTTRTLQSDDLWSITELEIPEDITEFADLRWFTGLERLVIHGYEGNDFSFLQSMPCLTSVDFSGCAITSENLELICSLPALEEINLSGCGLSNIAPLSSLTSLRICNLSDNSINNLTPLTSCTKLEELNLSRNAVNTVIALSELSSLTTLDLSYNALSSISALSGCTDITTLNIASNKLTEVDVLGYMVKLTVFDGSKNQVEDVSAMAACKKLEQFVMTDNLLKSIDFLQGIDTISVINIDYNDVELVPDFSDNCRLTNFSAAHNFLEELEGLKDLPMLNYVNADYNNIEDIDCLAGCANLVQVNVFGTYVEDVEALTDLGIIVNYNPL